MTAGATAGQLISITINYCLAWFYLMTKDSLNRGSENKSMCWSWSKWHSWKKLFTPVFGLIGEANWYWNCKLWCVLLVWLSLITDTDLGFGFLFIVCHVNQSRAVFSLILQPEHHRNGIYLSKAWLWKSSSWCSVTSSHSMSAVGSCVLVTSVVGLCQSRLRLSSPPPTACSTKLSQC